MITKRIWNKEYKLKALQDEFAESPREWQMEYSKMCIRDHRRYDFPNELEFDFNAYDDGDLQLPWLDPNQYFFWLDCYEHSGILFSLTWEWQQCRFDTANKCWFLIVTLDDNGEKSNGEARDQAKLILDAYNSYLNGEVYEYILESREIIEKDWKTFTSEWECIEACWWYYSLEDLKYDVVHSYKIFTEEDLKDLSIN